ncbi:CDP-alcohol phosphatidyltransferase family protein [Aquimarina gracilis]|uniref:CDP-alcohol phosphatidyltransferase family protein n=1 Tax=Aquimarina gracilis TaxID=874422 RepID=A0ABU6A0V2_9FLAO|nr:CDP-alcohol phosphatidyltransferase family protein [Aquimarina gracilis]MEB3347744.1 CDP-alcohol phosphatidyltransferase family protein [Aquimarina gracilis]
MKYPYSLVKNSFHSKEAWVNVLLLKYITVPLVFIMVNYTRITPNIISILSMGFGVLSAYYYFSSNVLFGGLMYFISYIFDATDGKVARITKTGKPYGAWMDISIDRLNLTLISTAIAYNYFLSEGDFKLLLLNSLFLGLSFIGSESRYNIDIYKLKNSIKDKDETSTSKYGKWCDKMGLIKEPISLPELFLFYLILSPQFGIEFYSCIIVSLLLVLRILKQQFFWVHVSKSK